MDDYDYCYECRGYGDDYYYDSETDSYEPYCNECPFNPNRGDVNDV